jgi:hypothetical protein
MKRTLLIIATALVVVIAGIGVYLYNSIDSIVKNAIERSGTEITGTRVSVGSVDISLRSGRGTVRGVRVRNPDGYADENAMELGEIVIDLDVGSLNRDPIIIEEIRVKAPTVDAELNEVAVSNVSVIRNHIRQYRAAAPKPAPGKQDAGYEKHFVIRSFVVEEGFVNADATRVGSQKWEFDLAPLRLSNVGGTHGALPDAIGKEIAAALFNRATQAVSDRAKVAATNQLKKKLGEILTK